MVDGPSVTKVRKYLFIAITSYQIKENNSKYKLIDLQNQSSIA